MKSPFTYLLALLLLIGSTSCQEELPLKPNIPLFEIDQFVNNLRESLDEKLPDYQIMIAQKGNLYKAWAEGNAIYPGDPGGQMEMATNTRMAVASVSKFVGAIAMAQVLEDNNISLDQPIHNYLPPSWKSQVHPDHWEATSPYFVSFRKLMQMETGIAFPTDVSMPSANAMLEALKQPAIPARVGQYQNGNFTLIRILIGEIFFDLNEKNADYNDNSAQAYYRYIDQKIFTPAEVQNVAPVNFKTVLPRAHQYPLKPNFQDDDGNIGWLAAANVMNSAGSGGLYLSVMDLGGLMAYFRYTEDILSAEMRAAIMDSELGLSESTDGDYGRYLTKQGTRGPEDCCDRAFKSIIMMFPNEIEVALLINANFKSARTLIKQSYDEAWTN
ncbi:MAG: serine hydrolase domain-containing protein [Bacteroidota bacterium]